MCSIKIKYLNIYLTRSDILFKYSMVNSDARNMLCNSGDFEVGVVLSSVELSCEAILRALLVKQTSRPPSDELSQANFRA